MQFGTKMVTVVAVLAVACGGSSSSSAPVPDAALDASTDASTDADATAQAPPPPKDGGADAGDLDAAPIEAASTTECGTLAIPPQRTFQQYGGAGAIGVYKVARVDEECSNAGGTHVSFDEVSGCIDPPAHVHLGGHACQQKGEWKVGDFAVLAYQRESFTATDPGACLNGLPTYEGVALAVVHVASAADGSSTLQQFGCTGH